MNKYFLSIQDLKIQSITPQQLSAIRGGDGSFDEEEDQGKHKTGALNGE